MSQSSPFELILRAETPLTLRAMLRNRSQEAWPVLRHSLRQPSVLELSAASGERVPFRDLRADENYPVAAMRIKSSNFVNVPLGGVFELARGEFRPQPDGTYVIGWDHSSAEHIRPGCYRARAVWCSDVDYYQDETGKPSGTMAHVWLGILTSNEATIRLPDHGR